MTKKQSTKRALILSTLSLLLCFSMFVGTTFAWFTDSVSSVKNQIVAGNLDVELYYQAEGQSDWTKVTGTTNIFKENTLWEPGHTEVVKLKVVNEGSLALKYTLGVNVASEVGSVNVNDKEFKLSDFIKFGIVDGAQTYTRDQAIAAVDATATTLKTAYNSGTTALDAKNDNDSDEKIVTMVVYMPTTVGNDANYKKGAAVPTINLGINLYATQVEAENDSFDNTYDKDAMTFVKDAAEAQAALDNATAGTIIKLAPGVNYGTLLLRPVDGNANTTTSLNEANGEGLTGYRNEYIRKVENLTIIGAPGATVDAIKVESGYIVNSGSSCNLVDVKGLVIDSVEFTDKADCAPHTYSAPIFFNLTWTDVDGLTVKNCKLIGNDDKVNFVYFTIDDSSAFDGVASNVTLTGNTVDGIARLCELRQTKNVTITDNVIKNTVLHGILLPVHNGSYTGDVTITGNTAVGINERFVRMAGAGDANVVIKDNTITDYFGKDDDYIKVTDSTATVINENNPMTRAYKASTVDELKDRLAAGGKIVLANNIVMDKSINLSNADFVLDGNGHTITMADGATNTYALFDITGGKATIKNVTFDGIKEGAIVRTVGGVEFNADNVTAVNGNHTQVQGIFRLLGKSTITNCTFKNNTCNMVISLNYDGANNDPQVVKNCVFENNTCNATAVVYYVKGDGCTLDGNEFVGNTVNCNGNGATVYMGFTEGNTITNNVFRNNVVNEAGASKRVAGALMIGYDAVITNNAFIDNSVTGTNAKANDVCASVYYTDIDLSGNYWGGEAPVENDNYFVEYPDSNNVIINDYLTTYGN